LSRRFSRHCGNAQNRPFLSLQAGGSPQIITANRRLASRLAQPIYEKVSRSRPLLGAGGSSATAQLPPAEKPAATIDAPPAEKAAKAPKSRKSTRKAKAKTKRSKTRRAKRKSTGRKPKTTAAPPVPEKTAERPVQPDPGPGTGLTPIGAAK
jgi:hypothetical protein